MKPKSHEISIRKTLLHALMLTSVSVLLLAILALIGYERFAIRSTLSSQFTAMARVISSQCAASLAFESPKDAQQIVSNLSIVPDVQAAALYDAKGHLFASFSGQYTASDLPQEPRAIGHSFEKEHLAVVEPVMAGGERIGTLYVRFGLGEIARRTRGFIQITFIVLSVALLFAYILSTQLQARISQPILALAETAWTVTQRSDYSVRAPEFIGGEIGLLTHAFNQMLVEIQENQNSLATELEERQRVAEALLDSEKRYHSLFESIDEGFCIIKVMFDENGRANDWRFLEVNPAFDRHGVKNATGKTIRELIPNLEEQWFDIYGKVALTGEPIRLVQFSPVLRRWFDLYAFRVGKPDEHKVSVIFSDVTARKSTEEELSRLKKELEIRVKERTADLEAANHELEAFGYTVSHDLRAPLRHIAGFISMLQKHAGATFDDQSRRYVQVISDSAQRMGSLIDDMLTLSRVGRATVSDADVDLEQLVEEARQELSPGMEGRNIEWQIGSLPTVRGDPTLLRVVVVNLLSNAVKYTRPRNPARIEIGCEEKADQVVCFVRDNGVGFSMDFVDKLFGVFQRLHRAQDFEGTGIGLASVRRIIQRHGGKTWATGEVDRGATFYFSLPNQRRVEP